MIEADRKPARGTRLGVAALVLVLHLIVAAGLVRAFAPDLGAAVTGRVTEAFDIALAPEPSPSPPAPLPNPASASAQQGAAAPEGRKARPREVAAPRARVELSDAIAPPVSGTGAANSVGAAAAGVGTGAGGSGQGTGAGTGGNGTGSGAGAAKPVKIAGDINSARDYPRDTRELRLGGSVIIALTVGTEGRVTRCRVVRPSRDAEADRITCQLATERFRFRPALDASGRAVESVYGWQQRWFTPGAN